MKKVWRMLLLAGVFTVLLCVSALAAGEGMYDVTGVTPDVANTETVTIKGEEKTLYVGAKKVSLTYSGANPGSYYLVMALQVDDPESATPIVPTVSNITYIDQDTAKGETVTFKVYPSKLENGKTYKVYLSSNDGTLNKLTEQGSFSYYVPYTLGDVDENGEITPADALEVLKHAVGKITLTGNPYLAANVVKSDGDVTVMDALEILKYSVGKITSFE